MNQLPPRVFSRLHRVLPPEACINSVYHTDLEYEHYETRYLVNGYHVTYILTLILIEIVVMQQYSTTIVAHE